VNLFVTDKLGSLTVYPPSHTTYILNLYDLSSSLVNNSFALTKCWEVLLWRNFRIEEWEVSSRLVTHAIKADKKRKMKLKIS